MFRLLPTNKISQQNWLIFANHMTWS